MFLWKNHVENKAGILVSDFFFFFKKVLYELKSSGYHINFNVFW